MLMTTSLARVLSNRPQRAEHVVTAGRGSVPEDLGQGVGDRGSAGIDVDAAALAVAGAADGLVVDEAGLAYGQCGAVFNLDGAALARAALAAQAAGATL